MEVQVAGSIEERNSLMPTLYVDTHRDKAELEGQIRQILKSYHAGMPSSKWMDPSNRMKPLDITKVLMGIRSVRENVKRFEQDNTVWARRKEYDYMDVFKVCEVVARDFYIENMAMAAPILASKKQALKWNNSLKQWCICLSNYFYLSMGQHDMEFQLKYLV